MKAQSRHRWILACPQHGIHVQPSIEPATQPHCLQQQHAILTGRGQLGSHHDQRILFQLGEGCRVLDIDQVAELFDPRDTFVVDIVIKTAAILHHKTEHTDQMLG